MKIKQIDRTLNRIRDALEAGKVDEAIKFLDRLYPPDLADAFSDLDDEDQAVLLPQLDISTTADLLEELDDEEAADVAGALPTDRLADVLDEMEPDEAADVLGDLPPKRTAEALAEMEDIEEVLPLLKHADETAGGLMTTSFIALTPKTAASEAISLLRKVKPESEIPYYLYVEDDNGRLIGIVGLRELVLADPDDRILSIMDTEVFYGTISMDQEDAARMMARYDLAALPIVDDQGVLQGVITHDDLVDIIDDEATEDIYRLANVSDADLTINSPVTIQIKRRLPWLYLNTLTALFAAWVISHFEALYAQMALLAVFQSVVTGMGGNAAQQSLAMIVRAIALHDISPHNIPRTVINQAITGLLQGVAVGVFVGLGVYLWAHDILLALILCTALIGNMFVAVIIGTLIPLALKVLKLDPALASTVLVTAITDSFGFFLFLGLASIFLH